MSGERFQVRAAAEMRVGEPYRDAHRLKEGAVSCARELARDGFQHRSKYRVGDRGADEAWPWKIIDTHCPGWQAFDAAHREGKPSRFEATGIPHPTGLSPDCGKRGPGDVRCLHRHGHGGRCLWSSLAWDGWDEEQPKPTDAEIVAAWEAEAARLEAAGESYGIREVSALFCCGERGDAGVTFEGYQEARSRELRRLAAASKERERNRIVCEGTLPEDL